MTPTLDALCVGGLSILVILPFLFLREESARAVLLPQLLLGATLLNGAHFIASYRLLYSSQRHVSKHRWASIFVPAGLVIYCSWATLEAGADPAHSPYVNGFLVFVAFYLALHYTGQAWGMMASFAHLEGIRISEAQRKTFRFCLYTLLAWQVVWSINRIENPPAWISAHLDTANALSHLAALATIPIAGFAFYSLARDSSRRPPLRVTIPYVSLYFWYALIWKFPGALMGVQIAHALQYLIFPIRVEANRHARVAASDRGDARRHMLRYGLALAGAACVVFVLFPRGAERIGDGFALYASMLILAINVHHFFIDGCVWKLRNPIVRDDIFAHLKSPAERPPADAVGWVERRG